MQQNDLEMDQRKVLFLFWIQNGTILYLLAQCCETLTLNDVILCLEIFLR